MRFFVYAFFVLLAFFVLAGAVQAAPIAPANLTAWYYTSSGLGLIGISWMDNATDEAEFRLYRKLSTDFSWPTVYTPSNLSYLTKFGIKSGTGTTQSNDPNANLPAGIYEYKIAACDSLGACSDFSNVASVTVGTSSLGADTTAPSMPSGFMADSISTSQVNLSWGPSTDNMGVSGYKVYRNSVYFATLSSGAYSYSDMSVYSGMTYSYYVIAYDAAGNHSSPSSAISVTVSSDTTPPTAPVNLTASSPSSSQVALSWGASTDNVGVAQYAVFRNNSYLGYTTSCCGYADNSVTAGATNTYYIKAYDAHGNISLQSNTVTITTPSSTSATTLTTDIILPVWPSGYTNGSSVLSSSSIKITWTAATDNMAVAGYKIYRNGTQITTTTLLEYTDSGLVASTAYNYAVAAYDAAGNISSQINFYSVITWSGTSGANSTGTDTTASAITNVRAENIMGPGAQIKWNTDDLSNSRVMYGATAGSYSLFSDSRCDGGTAYDVSAHCVNLMNLTVGTVYYYKVKSLNAAGLDAESVVYQFTTASSSVVIDATPPTPPTAISSYAISAFGISVSWSGAMDNIGVAGYKIYRNGIFLANTTSLSYADSGLVASTAYTYAVSAYDVAGNISGMSQSTMATTMANTNTTTVVVYAGISGKVIDSTGIAVSGANIYISSADRYYSAITDTGGNYSLASVLAGTYNAKAYAPSGASYQPISKSISLTAGQALVLDFQFAVGAKTIRGKISYPDGRIVANAGISAYNNASGAWTNGFVDAQGVYALKVSGGKWQVNIYPKYSGTIQTNDWTYMESPREVTFVVDESAETVVIDFTVKGAQVLVKGVVLLPDGSAPSSGIATVSLKGSSGFEQRPTIDSSGLFSMHLPADTYNGEIFSIDIRYGGVAIAPFSVSSDTVDLGKFYLKLKSEKIKGFVKDATGNAVPGVWVNANQYAGGKFVQAKSAEDGSFEILVSVGEWSVQVYADPMLGYSYNQSPKFLSVPAGGVVETQFMMTKSDAQISGNIVDANGQIISDASGYISTYVPSASMTMYASPSFGGQIEKGSFSFKLPAGAYTLNVNFPSNSSYIPPSPQSIIVTYGEMKKINLAITKTDVALSGFIKDDFGNIIKGLGDDKVKAYLSTKGGSWHNVKIDAGTGSFSAQISAGVWYLGYWTDPTSGFVSSGKDVEIILTAGESKNVDITLLKANSIISGAIKTTDGTPLANVWVSVNSRSFSTMNDSSSGTMYGSSYVAGANSDTLGKFDIKVPPGKYFLQSSYQTASGYLNPSEVEVNIESGKTAAVEIIFKKPDAILSGITAIDGKGVPAFVWAWRDSGGYASARADESGKYSFAVSRIAKWRVTASMERNGAYYKSADVVVEVGDNAVVTQDLTLLSLANIPATAERVVEAVKPQSVELSNGAKVVLPANSLATVGTASVTMKPEVEVPSSGSTSIVGTGYKVEAKSENGQGITNLNSEITISIPYDEADLSAKGLKPENLTLSFFDETTQIWKPIDKQVVDKENKIVSGVVSHLTLFALVAPADTMSPVAPSGVLVSAQNGVVALAWKNPSADFHHIKIYRSAQKGILGDAIFNYLATESKTDPVGTLSHYYVVRAVDLAGNESTNTAQYQVGATSTPSVIESSAVVSPLAQSAIFLARVNGDSRVYIVENGKKRWIKSAEEFNTAGYKWSSISLISATQLAGYADQFATPFQFAITIKLGARSEAVRKLQELLARDKAIYPQGLISGYYGSLTKSAIVRFQKKYKIKDRSGVVGAETRKKLNELSAL